MGATIHYRMLSKSDPHLPVNAPQSFMEVLRRAFNHDMPMTLRGSDVQTLRGILAAYQSESEALEKLIDAILGEDYTEDNAVEIYASY